MKKHLFFLLLAGCLGGMGAYASPGNDSLPPAGIHAIAHFDPLAATQKYLDRLPANSKAKSDAYFEGGYWLLLWNMLYEGLVAWIFLFGGLSAWIKRRTGRFRSVNLQNWTYILFYLLLAFLLSFPLSFYQDFVREHQYGLSNQHFLGWLADDLKALGVTLAAGGLALTVLYLIIRKTGKNWWVWGAGLSICCLVLAMIVSPVFISPLFNKYTPLQEGPVKEQILSLARANQVPAENVYQFDASLQSNRISANVSGFAGTTRVSLNDNLLKRCSPAEIKAVMGHELGHYLLHHAYQAVIELGVLLFFGFAFLNGSVKKMLSRYGARWGVQGIGDIGGLPLLYFLFSLYLFLATPVTNTVIRTQETEADHFGLNAAREPDGFAAVAMKFSEYRKIDPGYWEEIIFFDHPSGRNRVYSSMVWKAEQLKGQ